MKQLILQLMSAFPGGEYFQNKFIFALLIFLFFLFLAKVLLFVFSKYLEKIAAKTKTKIDDALFDNTKKPLFYFVIVYGLKVSLLHLEIDGTVTKLVNSVMTIIFLFVILRTVDILIETWGSNFATKTKTRVDEVLLPLVYKVVKVLFVLIGFIWVLDIWQVDITPYLAGVGISGLVLGLALQDSLKNVFGGITLLLDKTYQVGDKIKLEDGTVGTIHDIGLRSTKLMTYDNEVIYIPNGYLANSRVQNYSRPDPKVRTQVNFGVEYGSDVEKVRKVVLKTLSMIEPILKDPAPAVFFLEMGDSALKFTAKFWVERWDQAFAAKLEATEKIYNALRKSKIGIPFPTHTVYLKK